MYRFIFYILAIALELLLPRRRGWQRSSRNFYDFDDDLGLALPAENPNNGIAASIRANLRRRRALKACKKYLNKSKYTLSLRNKNVIFVFDTKNKTMTCVDNHNKARAATVVWAEQINFLLDKNDNIFEQTFDAICTSFNEKSNYSGLMSLLKNTFSHIQETAPQPKLPSQKKFSDDEKPIPLDRNREDVYFPQINKQNADANKLDINVATEEQLAQLPGISVIIAKKIIKYRDQHNGFSDLDEFFREMKIKPFFQTKLTPMITINPLRKKQVKNSDERIIDF